MMILQFGDINDLATLVSKADGDKLVIEMCDRGVVQATLTLNATQATELKQFLEMKGF
jgi:hypothetical protein